MKKIIIFVLSVCIAAAAFTGCAGKNTSKMGGEAHTKLKYVYAGIGEMQGCDAVWTEFNEKLKDYMPDTTVEFEVISYADYGEKWRLMSASKEQVDVAWLGWTNDFFEEVQKGSILPIDDLLKDVPDLTYELPAYLFDLTSISGKCYGVPNYQMMTGLPAGFKTPKSLADKYLDITKIEEITDKEPPLKKEDFDVFSDYLSKLKENGELGLGVAPSFLTWLVKDIGALGQYSSTIAANAVIDWRDDSIKVYDEITDFPDSIGYYELVNDWYKKGYIRKDITSLQDTMADEGKEGGYVLWAHSSFKGDSELQTKKCGFPILSMPLCTKLYIPHTAPTTNTVIPRSAADPEKSIKFIELLNTQKGKELYNMLVYGLEGKHYKKVSENKIEWLEPSSPGASSENNYGYDAWAIGNSFNAFQTQYDLPGWNDYVLQDVNEKATISPLIGFSLDANPIKLEISQYNAVKKEYDYLEWGANDNYRELLEQRNEKFKACGTDKIVEEVRKQIEDWKKNR